MKFLLIILIATVVISSCKQKEKERIFQNFQIMDCDEVNLIYYGHNDTLIYKAKDSLEIAALTEVISMKNENIGDSCRPSGKLIYKSKGKIVFNAEFSTSNTNESVACGFIAYVINAKEYKHKLTYQVGMLIDDIWNELIQSSLTNHSSIQLHVDTAKMKIKTHSNKN